MTRVLVAAGSAVVRAGLEAVVARRAELTVIGSAAGAATVAQQAEELEPDVVVLALDAHEEEVPPALPALAGGDGAPAVVLLAGEPGGVWAADALRAGARGVLPRDAAPEEIVAAVEAVAAGLLVVHPSLAAPLAAAAGGAAPGRPRAPHGPAAAPEAELTPREVEVLGMLAEGLANKQIAARLRISEHTVKFHVASIFAKLHAATRTEAVMIGARRGLIML